MGAATGNFGDCCFNGHFIGILRWNQLDDFWTRLREKAGAGWYIYVLGEAVPQTPVSAPDLKKFIDEIDFLLHRDHHEDYCGIVYADNLGDPTLVKIFDPNNLGSSCGSSVNRPPSWILSLMKPTEVNQLVLLPNNRKRWWNQLFGQG